MKRLRVDHIDLYQVHVPDPDVPYSETVGAFVDLQHEGKIRSIGVSNVSVEQLSEAASLCQVVSVQNAYNLARRTSEGVLEECERRGIVFIPHSPNVLGPAVPFGAAGTMERDPTPAEALVSSIAGAHGVSQQQVAVAWLLARSPLMLPIAGTSKLAHVDDNVDTAWLRLTDEDLAAIDRLGER